MATYTELPDPVRRPDGTWWIPRCPPHYGRACGPYETEMEAEDDRCGMEATINTPAWRSHIMDMEDGE